MSCNGWTNYETWAVKLWLDNEEGSYHAALALAEENRNEHRWDRAQAYKTWIMDEAPDLDGTLWGDLLGAALSEVDWQEIADAYHEELDPEEDEEQDEDDTPAGVEDEDTGVRP